MYLKVLFQWSGKRKICCYHHLKSGQKIDRQSLVVEVCLLEKKKPRCRLAARHRVKITSWNGKIDGIIFSNKNTDNEISVFTISD